MKKLLLYGLSATMLLFGASGAGSARIDLSPGKGTNSPYDQAMSIEITEAMQASVSSATGVIDPFPTIKRNTLENRLNADAFPVLDVIRPRWNRRSIQLSDLVASPDAAANYEFLLDIAQPVANKSLITQHELKVHLAFNGIGVGIATYADLQSSGTKLRDLNRLIDSRANYNSNLWKGSGQHIDVAFMLPTSMFSGDSLADHVNSYTQYGTLGHLGFLPQADAEEYALRERGTTPVPEPATMLLLGCGLVGLAGLGRKKFIK